MCLNIVRNYNVAYTTRSRTIGDCNVSYNNVDLINNASATGRLAKIEWP